MICDRYNQVSMLVIILYHIILYMKHLFSSYYLVTGTSKLAVSIVLASWVNWLKEILILSLTVLKPYPIVDSEIAPTRVGSGYFEELTG